MAEYIKRVKVHELIEKMADGYEYLEVPVKHMTDKINSIPAADVRPVVLCRDCKYNNACLTQAFVEEESKAPFDRNTFFCADGERGSNA